MKTSIKSASVMAALAALIMSSAVAAQGVYVGGAALQSRFDSDDFDVEDNRGNLIAPGEARPVR